MSTGGGDLEFTINLRGADEFGEGTTGMKTGAPSEEGMAPDPKFDEVVAATNIQDMVKATLVKTTQISAAEAVLAQYLRWIPFVNAETARNLAQGYGTGYTIGDTARAAALGRREGGTAGELGARAGVLGSRAAAAQGAITGSTALMTLGAAASSATLALAGLTQTTRLHNRMLEGITNTLQGTGILQGLEQRERARLLIAREGRALDLADILSRSLQARTTRQIATEELSTAIREGFLRSTQPIVEIGTNILDTMSDFLVPEIQRQAQVAGATVDHFTALARRITQILSEIRGDVQPSELWSQGLDPNALFNQPFAEDEPNAGLYNPRGGRIGN